MFSASFLREKFEGGLGYGEYVKTGTAEQQRRWGEFEKGVGLTEGQKGLVGSFVREMNVLVVSGIWCGDCVQQVPLVHRIAEGNVGKIHLRIVDRDEVKELSSGVRINGGDRVPVVLFLSEDFDFCALAGDRTLARYRAMAGKYLGAACATGVGPVDRTEVEGTMADWVDEFERVQLMLRLSPRLRQKYGD